MATAKTPTSVTGIWTHSGFTLLEVLVTVLLIGIIAGFAVLSIRGNDPAERVEREAQRLFARLELSQQEAVLRGEQHGVYFSPTGYTFLLLNREEEWGIPVDTDLPQSYELPQEVQLALVVEDRPVEFTQQRSALEPQVLLLSTGEATPFSVSLGTVSDPNSITVTGDLTGRLQWVRRDETLPAWLHLAGNTGGIGHPRDCLERCDQSHRRRHRQHRLSARSDLGILGGAESDQCHPIRGRLAGTWRQ
ncbi:MAG: type II secretion system minor pseudopilin GspH [Candidatus Competibacteraceae bacterium]|nr:type II secretion system minor pseudopilin GspH [Candidatus Competibacteraceae bacterium]